MVAALGHLGPTEGWPGDCWSSEGARQWPKMLPEAEKEKGEIPLPLPSSYPPAGVQPGPSTEQA